MALIDIKGLKKIYNPGENQVNALNGIDLSVERGEFVSIIGHSGSGKSTFMNMLGCLDVPTEGTYFLDGYDVKNMDDDELSAIRNMQIGFIFQNFNLIHSLTAIENVELPLVYRGTTATERRELAFKALERVGLETRLHHKPMELSGGQQQRVAIARALATSPPMILADEPTGNLDTKTGAEVMNMLKELHKEGSTIILITHDNEVAEQAERIVRIIDGVITEDRRKTPVTTVEE